MTKIQYRIESSHPIVCPYLPQSTPDALVFSDRALAVVVAAKSLTQPHGQEIRVVHILTGEVVYRKSDDRASRLPED